MSNVSKKYPEYNAIEGHIRRAHAERSVAIAHMIAGAAEAVIRGTKRFFDSMGDGLAADRDRRAIEADSFLKRSVPRY
jgi:hypothetical protein